MLGLLSNIAISSALQKLPLCIGGGREVGIKLLQLSNKP